MDHSSQQDPHTSTTQPPHSQPSTSDPSTLDSSEDTPSGSLIKPIAKEDALRQHMAKSPHPIDWLSKPTLEDNSSEFQSYREIYAAPSIFSTWGLPLLLFGITVFTTLWAGAYSPLKYRLGALEFLYEYPNLLTNGIPFSATLLAILVTHELGHFIAAKIHRVPTSFPFFIPGPPHLIGTFGAVIRMRSPIMKRQALFDIGVAGPIAGFIASIIAFLIALPRSQIISQQSIFGVRYGDSLLVQFLGWLILGPLPPNHDLGFHPIGLAAWFGFFLTAINLFPLGQLDGGHVAFAVLGDKQKALGLAMIPILIYFGLTGWPGWFVWVGLAAIIGISHPPVSDPFTNLGRPRQWIAWSTLAIFILTFAPIPFSGI